MSSQQDNYKNPVTLVEIQDESVESSNYCDPNFFNLTVKAIANTVLSLREGC